MKKHSYNFVESYDGLVGFGLNRETDEKTVWYYLQKFSDDVLMEKLLTKLSDDEIAELFLLMTRLLKKHLTDSDYHHLFLKDDH
jgi:hypothetical protein